MKHSSSMRSHMLSLALVTLAVQTYPDVVHAQEASCERASSLGFAAAYENVASLTRLLDAGVGVNCVSTGQTALILAARWNKPENVEFLLANGADPYIEDVAGSIAIEVAAQQRYAEVTRILSAYMGVLDPLAPRRRAGAPDVVRAPAPPRLNPPPAADGGGPDRQPGMPAQPGTPLAAGAARWAPFGTYTVGDRVQYHSSNGWHVGTVLEVGPVGDYSRQTPMSAERKYLLSDDRFPGPAGYYDWGVVAGLAREPFWTEFFVGDWALGEVMAVNSRIEGNIETTEYSYHTAREALRVQANGTYEWKDMNGAVTRGRWMAAPDGPGIVIQRGAEGRDWAFHNGTNAVEENIRGIETGRLTSPGVMSIAAKRPISNGR